MIYFITEGNSINYVKIGYTNNLNRRLRELQIGNPRKLKPYFVIKGNYQLEQEVHKEFKDYRSIGEWFHFSAFILDYINKIREESEEILNMYNNQLTEKARLAITKLELEKVFIKLDNTNKFIINLDEDIVDPIFEVW